MSGKRTQKKAQAKNLMKARLSKARATKAKQHKSKQTDLPKNFKLLDDGGKVTITNKNLQSIYSNAGSLFNSKFHYYNNTFNGKHQLDKIHKVYGTVQLTEKLLLDTNLNKLTDSTGEIHAPKSVASEEVLTGRRQFNSLQDMHKQLGGAVVQPPSTPTNQSAPGSETFRTTPQQVDAALEWARLHAIHCLDCQRSRTGSCNIKVTCTTRKRSGTAVTLNLACSESGEQCAKPPEMVGIHKWPKNHPKYHTDTMNVARAGFEDVMRHVLANGNGYAEYLRLHPNGYSESTYTVYKSIIGRHTVYHEHCIESLAQQLSIMDMKMKNNLKLPADGDGKWDNENGRHCVFRLVARQSGLILRSIYMSRTDCSGTKDHLTEGDSDMEKLVGKQELWKGTSHSMEARLALLAFRECLDWGVLLEPVMDGDGKLQLMLRIACTMQALKNATKLKETLVHSSQQFNDDGFPPTHPLISAPDPELLEEDPSPVAFVGLTGDTAEKIRAAYTGCMNHCLRALWLRIGNMENVLSKHYPLSTPQTVLSGYTVPEMELAVSALEKVSKFFVNCNHIHHHVTTLLFMRFVQTKLVNISTTLRLAADVNRIVETIRSRRYQRSIHRDAYRRMDAVRKCCTADTYIISITNVHER